MAHDPISPSFMKEKWGDQTIRVLYYHTKWRSFSRQCVTEREFVHNYYAEKIEAGNQWI